MLALLVYLLFGDQIADQLSGGGRDQDQQVEDVTPRRRRDPDGGDDVTMPEDGDDVTGPEGTEDDGGAVTTPQQTDPSALPETLTIAYLGSSQRGVHHVRGG